MTVTITTAAKPMQGPQFTQAAAEPANRPRVRLAGDWTPGSGPTVQEPPSTADLQRERDKEERRRQDAMRPADKSVAAVQSALNAIVGERAIAETRLIARKDNVAGLSDGSYHPPAECQAALNALQLAEIDAAQYERMEIGMRLSLERARLDEAEDLARLAERAKEAAGTVARFRAFIERDYAKHAAAIGKGLTMERAAEEAMHVLRAAAAHLPGHSEPDPLPRVPNGTLTEAYRFRACLPGTDVRPVTT